MAGVSAIYPDTPLDRRVAFAIELWDPVTLEIIARGARVTVRDNTDRPIVNRSGRFIWFQRNDLWPQAVTVDPGALPYEPIENLSLTEPAEWPEVTPAQRLIRIQLTPTSAYNFPDGVSAVRGTLKETSVAEAPAVTGARAWLDCWDAVQNTWQISPDAYAVRTDAFGQFAAYLRAARATTTSRPDVESGKVRVRLRFDRRGVVRTTPDDFEFVPPQTPPFPRGRIPYGSVLAASVRIAWNELV